MREALLCDEPNDVVSTTTKKKKSDEVILTVARSRSQAGSTRRVTPTTLTSSPSLTAAVNVGVTVAEKPLANGDLYIGGLSGNAPHGSGKYLWTDGCMYEGEWRRGKAYGKGKFSWPSGATYEGDFKSGRMEGLGTFIGSDGDTYRGSWSSDRKHGYGEKRYANGDFYKGYWKRNVQDGQGRYVWKNGNEYEGEWKNGVISGRGVLLWANGNRYSGEWENGVPKGSGVFTWPDSSCYVGSWNKDLKIQQMNGTFYPGNGKERGLKSDGNGCGCDNLMITMRKRSSVDGARGSVTERNFPRICIWESDGEAGDIYQTTLNGIFAEHFKCGRQEAAREFLRYVIDACHNTCLRLKKLQQQRRYNNGCKGGENVSNGSSNGSSNSSSGSSVVKEIFVGALQSQVKCLSCGNESNKVDEIMDISLDVLLSNLLKDAFQKFFQPEVLDGNNKYKCDNGKKLVAARKQMSILQAPNVLVIQLKRFESVFGGKIDLRKFWCFRVSCVKQVRRLRERFQVDPADYMLPVCGSDVLRELSSPRKSGRCFYLTQDDRFMIKTVRKSEVKVGCHPFDFCFVNQKSIFPKNFKFKKEELVRLWMAEDLLLHPKGENLEEVGTEYLDALVSSSFFQRSHGKSSLYVMHDLLNELAKFVFGEFSFRMEDDNSYDMSEKTRYLSYYRTHFDAKGKFEAFHGA